jgi:uncharacterized membrane protein
MSSWSAYIFLLPLIIGTGLGIAFSNRLYSLFTKYRKMFWKIVVADMVLVMLISMTRYRLIADCWTAFAAGIAAGILIRKFIDKNTKAKREI